MGTGVVVASLQVGPLDSARDVEQSLARTVTLCGPPRLLFRGREISDSPGTLTDLGIEKGASLQLIIATPQLLASGSSDQTARLCNLHTGACVTIMSGHTRNVTAVSFSPTGLELKTIGADRTSRLWDVQTGECKEVTPGPGFVASASFSPRRTRVITGSVDFAAKIYNRHNRQVD